MKANFGLSLTLLLVTSFVLPFVVGSSVSRTQWFGGAESTKGGTYGEYVSTQMYDQLDFGGNRERASSQLRRKQGGRQESKGYSSNAKRGKKSQTELAKPPSNPGVVMMFKCQFCGRLFGRKANCVKHERTHTGEKPFTCRYCQKTFASDSGKALHERLHTGEKPFVCQVCGKAFADRSNHRKHENMHRH